MIRRKKVISGIALSGLLAIAMLMQGCATPIEVKNASKSQIELIKAVGEAVVNMQTSFDQFHKQKQDRIIEAGRMRIAQKAIETAVPDESTAVNADKLFLSYNDNIQPWIDYAFVDFDGQIKRLEEEIKSTNDEKLKDSLSFDLDDLKKKQADLHEKPQEVKNTELIYKTAFENETKTAERTHLRLEILRKQLALMNVMHGKVDAWLAIDVSPTQEQVNTLQKNITDAILKLDEDKTKIKENKK